MLDRLKGLDLSTNLILEDFFAAGDGGSICLSVIDSNSTELRVTLYQSRWPENYTDPNNPVFFILNEATVPVRSETEKTVLSALKKLKFGDKIAAEYIHGIQETINERVSFIESDEYLRLTSKKGRV